MKYLWLLFVFVACAQTSKTPDANLYDSNKALTENLKASRYSNIYFSGQPKSEDWKTLKEQGFTHVINLRQSKEYDEKAEAKQLKELGIIYSHMPMDAKQPLSVAQVKGTTDAVVAHRKKGKTLVHCGSGNRAAYWAGAHFYLDHDYPKDEAIKMAKKLGLTSDKLATKLDQFIENNKK